MIKPNLFILGAPKSGTSSMAHYLSQHPDVILSTPKEPNFFCSDVTGAFNSAENLNDYLGNCFPSNFSEYKFVCDASVSSLYSDEAVDKILKFNPSATFLVMLRNPTDLVYSFHQQLVNSFQEDEHDFETAWNLQKKRRLDLNIPKSCRMPKSLQYGKVGLLGGQLKRLYQKVDESRVKVIFFEDFSKDPLSEFNNVIDFLKLDYFDAVKLSVVNKSKQTRFKLLRKIVNIIANIKERIGFKGSLGVLTYITNKNFKPYERPSLNNSILIELGDYFESDINLLQDITGRDLSLWKSKGNNRKLDW